MEKLPESDNSLLLRTDFADDDAWDAVCEVTQAEGWMGFRAYLTCVSDPSCDGLTVDQIVAMASRGGDHTYLFVADRRSMADPEHPVLVVDLWEEPGRTFRVIPYKMCSVENNLSIANCEFADFADDVDADGVFRGHPEG